jgi:hypothetical protein
MLVEHFHDKSNTGAYFAIGNTVPEIQRRAARDGASLPDLEYAHLSEAAVRAAAAMPPTLRQLSAHEGDHLIRHGWEVADCTLAIYHPSLFQHRAWPGIADHS